MTLIIRLPNKTARWYLLVERIFPYIRRMRIRRAAFRRLLEAA